MNALKHHEIPGHVTISTGRGGLPVIRVETERSVAEIYQHGAQVTAFEKRGGQPLLFLSECSEFHPEKPIRGGVPLVFPWFGKREGMVAHGFARLAEWDLLETLALPDGSVRVTFRLPAEDEFIVDFVITVSGSLTMELIVTNTGASDFSFENCLHTYFQIGDIRKIELVGLKGESCLVPATGTEYIETGETIRFTTETDCIYQNSTATVEIRDPDLGRSIIIRKTDSLSTVVWNPWRETAKRMTDLGDDEWLHMVCVESGNIKAHTLTLAPGEISTLKVEIDSMALA